MTSENVEFPETRDSLLVREGAAAFQALCDRALLLEHMSPTAAAVEADAVLVDLDTFADRFGEVLSDQAWHSLARARFCTERTRDLYRAMA